MTPFGTARREAAGAVCLLAFAAVSCRGSGYRSSTLTPADSELIQAIQRRDVEKFRKLLAQGANPSARDRDGLTSFDYAAILRKSVIFREQGEEIFRGLKAAGTNVTLHAATLAGEAGLVSALLRKGAKVNARRWNGLPSLFDTKPIRLPGWGYKCREHFGSGWSPPLRWKRATPLHLAALRGHKEVVRILIAAGAKVNTRTNRGERPVHVAAWGGHAEMVEMLIAAGADVNTRDSLGYTPMGWALKEWDKRVVKALIDAGAEDALAGAVALGDIALVEKLIAEGADVNARDRAGMVPLHKAASKGDMKMVRVLLAAGADANAKNRPGTGPIHYAVVSGDKEVVAALIEAGAAVDAKDEDGTTPFFIAVSFCYKELARSFVELGADVNARSNSGKTPLHAANEELTRMLIACGADLDVKRERYGRTPLSQAVGRDRTRKVALLIAAGADVNAREKCGWTPLQVAILWGHDDVAAMLIQAGAEAPREFGLLKRRVEAASDMQAAREALEAARKELEVAMPAGKKQ